MKYIIKLKYALILLIPTLGSCNFLDVVPEKDIETIESIFEQRQGALNWLKTCYTFLADGTHNPEGNIQYAGGDEFVAGDYLRQSNYYNAFKIGDGTQNTLTPYCNMWIRGGLYAGIRYCNTFINRIDGVFNMEQLEKDIWKAEIKALKAHFYFILLEQYGPIILVPNNISVESELDEMLQARSPIDECVSAIVALCNESMSDIPPYNQKEADHRTFHSLESVAMLKTKALLLAASPLYNGNSEYSTFVNKNEVLLFSQTYDPDKWRLAAEAADEAVNICESNGKKLIDDDRTGRTTLQKNINNIYNSLFDSSYKNSEAIFMLKNLSSYHFNIEILPYIKYDENREQANFAGLSGSIAASMTMVEMYYSNNGLPIEEDKTYNFRNIYEFDIENSSEYNGVVANREVISLHLRREPRFYAHIASDGTFWQRGPSNTNDRYEINPYKNTLFGTEEDRHSLEVPINLTGYWVKKLIKNDFQSGSYINSAHTPGDGAVIWRLAELYLMQAEAWNEYDGPSRKVHAALDKVRKRAGIPNIEDAWIRYAKNPGMIKSKEGLRAAIHQEYSIEFAFEGKRYFNLTRWLRAATELNKPQFGWNVFGENKESFYNNGDGPTIVWSKRRFNSSRDYLQPIKSDEIQISGNKQNPGWN